MHVLMSVNNCYPSYLWLSKKFKKKQVLLFFKSRILKFRCQNKKDHYEKKIYNVTLDNRNFLTPNCFYSATRQLDDNKL